MLQLTETIEINSLSCILNMMVGEDVIRGVMALPAILLTLLKFCYGLTQNQSVEYNFIFYVTKWSFEVVKFKSLEGLSPSSVWESFQIQGFNHQRLTKVKIGFSILSALKSKLLKHRRFDNACTCSLLQHL